MAAGDKAIYREITAGGLLSAAGGNPNFDTTVIEETGSFNSLGDKTTWTCDDAGHYLVFGAFVGTITSGSNARLEGTSFIEIGSIIPSSTSGRVFGDQSWGSRTLKTQLNKIICNSAGIALLGVGDTVKLRAQMTGNSSPANCTFDSNRRCLGVLKLDDTGDFIRLRTTASSPVATGSFQDYDLWDVSDEIDTGSFGWLPGAAAEWVDFTQLGWYWVFISLHATHSNPGAAGREVSCMAILEEDENGDGVTITERARATTYLDGQDGCDDGYLNFKMPIDNQDVDARFRVRFKLDGVGSEDYVIDSTGTSWTASYLGRQDIDTGVGVMTSDDTGAPNPKDRQLFDTWTVTEDSVTADSFTSLGNPNREMQIDTNAFTLAFFQFNCSRPSTVASGQPFNYRIFVRNTITGPLYGDQKAFTRNLSTTEGNSSGASGMLIFQADDTEDYGLHVFRNTSSTDSTLQIDDAFTSIQFFSLGTVFPRIREIQEVPEISESVIYARDIVHLVSDVAEVSESIIYARAILHQIDGEVLEGVEGIIYARAIVHVVQEVPELVDGVIYARNRAMVIQEIAEVSEGVIHVLTSMGNQVVILVSEILEISESMASFFDIEVKVSPHGRIARGGGQAGLVATGAPDGMVSRAGGEKGLIVPQRSGADAGRVARAGGEAGRIVSIEAEP